MTLLKMSGFEYDDFSTYFTSVAGSNITSIVRSGARAFQLGNSLAVPLGAGEDDGVILGLGIYCLQSGSRLDIAFLEAAATAHSSLSFNTTNSAVALYRGSVGGTLLDTSDPYMNVGVWNHLEMKLKVADAGGLFEVRLNGNTTPIVSFSGDTRSGGTDGLIDLISIALVGGGWIIDDLHVLNEQGSKNNDYLGDRRIYPINPNGNGNYSQLTGSDGNSTDNYQQVDEGYTINNSDYNGSATVDQIDTYAYENLPAGLGVIDGILIHTKALKSDSGDKSARRVYRRAGTDNFGSDLTLPAASPENFWEILEDDPIAAGAWTPTNLDASEFGFQTRA